MTGGLQTFAVPAGVQRIRIDASGAQGAGGSPGGPGGLGGHLVADLDVQPGQVLTIMVGGQPSGAAGGFGAGGAGGADGGGYGGGGGGASDVRVGSGRLIDRIVAAGGGGGTSTAQGGGAGGPAGQTGSTGSCRFQGCYTSVPGAGGSPATALAVGGSGGGSCRYSGDNGGGGGGGWWGGGGASGGCYFTGSGGGGGSSDVKAGVQLVLNEGAVNTGNGSVTIAWPISGLQPYGGPLTNGERRCDCNPVIPSAAPANPSVGHPVNVQTGTMWHTFADLAVDARRPLAVTRTYSSDLASVDSGFGYGWVWSYGMRLGVTGSTATATFENGSEATFTLTGSTWRALPRTQATLVHEVDDTWTLTRQAKERVRFDSTGRLLSLADLNGETITVSYPSATEVTVASSGRSITLTKSGSRFTSARDSSSPPRVVSYAYSGAGDLIEVTNVDGGKWSLGYDGAHRLTTMRSPRFFGDVTTVPAPVVTTHYDGSGRVDWQDDQLGRRTTFDYAAVPNGTVVTSPAGRKTLYRYADGLLTSRTEGYGTLVGATWSFTYDLVTLGRTSITDPNHHVSSATFDNGGNQLTSSDALGRTSTITWNDLREPLTVTVGCRRNHDQRLRRCRQPPLYIKTVEERQRSGSRQPDHPVRSRHARPSR
ncbi:MAG: DUF6531 domain-containing protein [Acidimicrobiales bacterium]